MSVSGPESATGYSAKKIVAECPLCAGPFLGTGDKAVNKTSEKSLPSWDTVASGDRKGKSSDFQF